MSLQQCRTRDITQSLLKGKIKVPKRILISEIYTKLQGWVPPEEDEDGNDTSPETVDYLIDWMVEKGYIYKRRDWIYSGKFPEKTKKTGTGRSL